MVNENNIYFRKCILCDEGQILLIEKYIMMIVVLY